MHVCGWVPRVSTAPGNSGSRLGFYLTGVRLAASAPTPRPVERKSASLPELFSQDASCQGQERRGEERKEACLSKPSRLPLHRPSLSSARKAAPSRSDPDPHPAPCARAIFNATNAWPPSGCADSSGLPSPGTGPSCGQLPASSRVCASRCLPLPCRRLGPESPSLPRGVRDRETQREPLRLCTRPAPLPSLLWWSWGWGNNAPGPPPQSASPHP